MASDGKKRFEIRLLVKDDIEEVANLVAEVKSEREVKSVRQKKTRDDVYKAFGKPEAADCAKENLSFVCIDHSLPPGKQMVAYRLCRTLKMSEIDTRHDEFDFGEAMEFHYRGCRSHFLNRHPECQLSDHLTFVSVGVKNGYENRGIATKLTKVALNAAKQHGFKFVFAMVSSTPATHIFRDKLKMKIILEYNFDDINYKGVYYLKGIRDPDVHRTFELDLNDWIINEHKVDLTFD